MEGSLEHEDLLIRLRAKLNEEKIKLWEPPYLLAESEVTPALQDLARKYDTDLKVSYEVILQSLRELQIHSLDRSKANEEFKETGCATFRIKATLSGEKPRNIKVQKKLEVLGEELIAAVAQDLQIDPARVKLIVNGKVIKPTVTLEEQGLKNGLQIMALIMAENAEAVQKEDAMYKEMISTRNDALLLTESFDDTGEDDYIKLEDQTGKALELPRAERRSLMVGLALHSRGRAAADAGDFALALLLFLEADNQLSECRSSILETVDNWGVLQLDIAWCYLCLRQLSAAADANARLAKAEQAFRNTYGTNFERLIALKGTPANELVLIARLYLLQGIVAYHQNRRDEARRLLHSAEQNMNALRVDESAVVALMELGWSGGQARVGLRATGGQVELAHHFLETSAANKEKQRQRTRRRRGELGVCEDGTPVKPELVESLVAMGYRRRVAAAALRRTNNHAGDAVRIIQEHPHLFGNIVAVDRNLVKALMAMGYGRRLSKRALRYTSNFIDEAVRIITEQPQLLKESTSDDSDSPSSDGSVVEPDEKLVAELEAMGYLAAEARTALRMTRNSVSEAVDLLVAGGGHVDEQAAGNPSTSTGRAKKARKHKPEVNKKERQEALQRLRAAIKGEEDDHLDSDLQQEEQFLAQYKSLL